MHPAAKIYFRGGEGPGRMAMARIGRPLQPLSRSREKLLVTDSLVYASV